MVEIDPILVAIAGAIGLFFFLLFLFLRRITTGFREGYEQGRKSE